MTDVEQELANIYRHTRLNKRALERRLRSLGYSRKIAVSVSSVCGCPLVKKSFFTRVRGVFFPDT